MNGDGMQASLVNYDAGLGVEQTTIDYHLAVNEAVNEKLKEFFTADTPNVSPVSDEDECDSSNVSTFCLASIINNELYNFEEYLLGESGGIETSGTISNEDGDEEETEFSDLEAVLEASVEKQNQIDDEIAAAEAALDLLLAVYDQIQVVYPIHVALADKDESLFASLEKFNEMLSEVRDEVEVFPSTFNDATMVDCK